MRPGVFLPCALALLAPAVSAQTPDDYAAIEQALQRAIERVAPSTVTVETFGGVRRTLGGGSAPAADAPKPDKPPPRQQRPLDPKDQKKPGPQGFLQAQGATTGVVLSADGWILTSRFGLSWDPTTVLVTLADGRTLEARRCGEDTSRGLALLKVEATDLPVPKFVAPQDARVGQWAFALGRTFGRKEPSVHMGIVSARNRIFGRALQIDASTSPANYGGPVVDLDGQVLGLSVPLSLTGRDAGVEVYDSGIGFAATIAGIEPLLARMREGEVLHRGFLGVSTAPDHMGPGAKVASLSQDAPAKASGLKKNDVILAVDGVEVRNAFHLQVLISSKMAGDPAGLKVQHKDGEVVELTVMLAELPESERAPKKPAEDAGQLPWEEEEKEKKK